MPGTSTILLADDEPYGLELLVKLLTPLGHHLLTAADGRAALESAERHQPDLIVLDVMMPHLDGFEVCRRLRSSVQLAEVPVLLVTALDDRDSRLRAIDAGADGFISKPYDRVELRSRISTILRLNRYRRLLAARQKVDAVIEFAPHGIVIVDEQAGLLLANPTLAAMLGGPPALRPGTALAELFTSDQLTAAGAALARTLAAPDTTTRTELTLRRHDGSALPVELVGRVLQWDGRAAVQFVVHDVSERKAAEARLERQLRRLAMLRDIDMTVSSSTESRTVFNLVLNHLRSGSFVDAVALFLVNRATGRLDLETHLGFRRAPTEPPQSPAPDLGELIALVTPEAMAERRQTLAGEEFIDADAVPLVSGAQLTGVLEIYRRTRVEVDGEWLDFLTSVASSLALAVEKTELIAHLRRSNQELADAYDRTLEGWVVALDLRDKETEGHTQRVTALTVELARSVGIDGEALEHLRRGALLHDIGKIGIPDRILLKAGALDPNERQLMERHPVYAYHMLSPIAYLAPALDIPYCHHERWDGTGYPRGLKGLEIPLAARLFSVVDVWDALTSDRPYRKALPADRVAAMIHDGSGTHFDPDVVRAFLALMVSKAA